MSVAFGCGLSLPPQTRLSVSVSKKEETRRLRFRLVSFRRANKHLFTVGAEAAKEARPSESPLGSSSSVFLNFFSPLSRSGSPPRLSLSSQKGPRVCMCVCASEGVCLCIYAPVLLCAQRSANLEHLKFQQQSNKMRADGIF